VGANRDAPQRSSERHLLAEKAPFQLTIPIAAAADGGSVQQRLSAAVIA